MNDHSIATLIASRICHDLINPIGAIHNGIELMEMVSGTSGLEMDLIRDSAADARARIEFFRLAFGTSKQGHMMDRDAIIRLSGPIFDPKRFALTWGGDARIDRLDAQILALALLCLERQMPTGGHIFLSPSEISAVPTAPRAVLPQWSDGFDAMAGDVQFLLLPIAVKASGKSLKLHLSEGRFDLYFTTE